jgi:hypothetical protein
LDVNKSCHSLGPTLMKAPPAGPTISAGWAVHSNSTSCTTELSKCQIVQLVRAFVSDRRGIDTIPRAPDEFLGCAQSGRETKICETNSRNKKHHFRVGAVQYLQKIILKLSSLLLQSFSTPNRRWCHQCETKLGTRRSFGTITTRH